MGRRRDRRGEAGFTLVELLASAVLLVIGMLFFAGLFGSTMATLANIGRTRLGKEWAEVGMGNIAARSRRPPNDKPRTEYGLITACAGCEALTDGSARKTGPNGYGTEGEMSQQWAYGDGWVDFLPPTNYGGMTLVGPSGSRGIVIGYGGDMSITEHGWTLAATYNGNLTRHQGGDRYRITFTGGTWSYYRYRGTTRELLFTDSTNIAPQPGFPLRATFWLYYQGTEITNMKMSGIFIDPLALPDGGDLTPSSSCVYPYCDQVWQSPRAAGVDSPPVALRPGASPAAGAQLLFVRRFKITTLDPATGLREIKMTLALSPSTQPFLTRETRIMANK